MTIISGHQPVYLPWLGLFHKLALCDVFVYMDTVQYLEKDWNNRNKIRTPQGWSWLTVPIDRKQTKGRMLDEIVIRGHEDASAKDFWQAEHWKSIRANYAKTPFFKDYEPDLQRIYVETQWERLIDLCWEQFKLHVQWLGLGDRKIVRMLEMTFEGHKDELVLDHCRKLQGDAVVFGAMGRDYVNVDLFSRHGISVYFQDYRHPEYTQRYPGFEPYMAALDLLMNHGPEAARILMSGNVSREELTAGQHWVSAKETEGEA